jgi:hypothetical protein
MSDGLELFGSRVGRIEWVDGGARVHFTLAILHKSKGKPGRDPGTVWAQEVELILADARRSGTPPRLPGNISDGYLEVGGIRHEVIPLPFSRKVDARLCLQFANGTAAEIVGRRPFVELLGAPGFLEDGS